MFQNNERNPHVSIIPVGTISTGAGLSAGVVVPGLFFRKRSRIKNVYFANNGAISKDNANHMAVALQDNAGSPVAYAKADTSDAAVVANRQYALTLQAGGGAGLNTDSATQQETDVPAGTMLNAKVTGLGTAAPTNGVVIVEWYPL